jgi:Skp family chaperone for outer membrane proteins
MKAMFCAGSLVMALAAVIGAGRLFAEGKEQKPARAAKPHTRIALVNLTQVIKNYDKYKDFQGEMKTTVKTFEERDKKLRAQGEKLRIQMEKARQQKEASGVVPAKAEDIEEKLKKIQRDLEDNQARAKKARGKKSEDEMKILYMDVAEASRRYAVAHDIEVVLHYNDAVTPEEALNPQNIARKLNTGPLTPLYTAAGVDISTELTDLLNQRLRNN